MATQDEDGANQPETTQTEDSLLFEIDGELYQINVGDQAATQVIHTEDEEAAHMAVADTEMLPTEFSEDVEETVVPQEMTYITLQLPENSDNLPMVVESLDPDTYNQLGMMQLVVPPADSAVLDTNLMNQPNMVTLSPSQQAWQHLTLNRSIELPIQVGKKRPSLPGSLNIASQPRKKSKYAPISSIAPVGGEPNPDFEIIERGSAHGQALLLDAAGYSYTFKKTSGFMTYWRCSVRNTKVCKASIIQIGSTFNVGSVEHDHEVNPTQRVSSKVIARLKQVIRLPQYKHRGIAEIVREVVNSFAAVEHIGQLNKTYLDRIVSRERQNLKNLASDKKAWETDSDLSDSGENASDLACATLEVESDAAAGDGENMYEILNAGWHGRFPLLVDHKGFSYILVKRVGECAYWQCPEHRLGRQCPVLLTEENDTFLLHDSRHIHPAQPEKQLRRKFRMEINNEINKIKKSELDVDLLIDVITTRLVTQNMSLQDKMPRLRRWAQKNINKIVQKCYKLQTDEITEYINAPSSSTSSPKGHEVSPVPSTSSNGADGDDPDPATDGQWELLPHGTQKGGPLLIDPRGCLYAPGVGPGGVVRCNSDHQVWRCTAQYNHKDCENVVVQKDNVFHHGFKPHHHPVDPRDGLVNRVKAALLNTMHKGDMDDVPIHEIVTSVMQQMAPRSAYLLHRKRMLYNVAHRKRVQMMKMKIAAEVATEYIGQQGTDSPAATNESLLSEEPEASIVAEDSIAASMDLIADVDTADDLGEDSGEDYEDQEEAFVPREPVETQPVPEVSHILRRQEELAAPEDPVVPDYEILDRGSNQGQPILIDGHGYVYAMRHKAGGYLTYWRCNIRNKRMVCFASVTQNGSTFRFGSKGHIHPANPRRRVAIKISTHLKEQLRLPANNHKTPGDLVREALALYQMHDLISHLQPLHLEKMVIRERSNFHSGYNRAWEMESDTDASDDMCENPSKRMGTEKEEINPSSKDVVDYQLLTRAWRDTLPLVVDTKGYHYSLEKKIGMKAYWGCPFKTKGRKCPAVVMEENGVFCREPPVHTHPGKPYKQLRRKFKVELRSTMPLMRHQDIPVDMIIEETTGYVLLKNPTCRGMIPALRRWAQKVVPGIVKRRGRPPEPIPECLDVLGQGVEYEIVENGTQRGGPLLLDKHGNCYCIKMQRPEESYTLWRCTKRTMKVGCEATVAQHGNVFAPNTTAHNHEHHPQRCIQRKVRAALSQVLDRLVDKADVSTTEVVEEVLAKFADSAPWMQAKKSSLIRMANRKRKSSEAVCVLIPVDEEDGEIDDCDLTDAVATIDRGAATGDTGGSGVTENTYPELVWQESDPEFEIVPRGSQKGQNLLLHRGKYAYTMRPSTKQYGHTWICSVRNTVYTCPASVKQEDGRFIPTKTPHCHPYQPDKLVTARACSALRDFIESSASGNMKAMDIVKAVQNIMQVNFSHTLEVRLRKMASHLTKKAAKTDATLASHIQKLSKRLSHKSRRDPAPKQPKTVSHGDHSEDGSDEDSEWEQKHKATRPAVRVSSRSRRDTSGSQVTVQESSGGLKPEDSLAMVTGDSKEVNLEQVFEEEVNDVEESQVIEQWEVPLDEGAETDGKCPPHPFMPTQSSVESVGASNIDILVEVSTRALAESTNGATIEYLNEFPARIAQVKLEQGASGSEEMEFDHADGSSRDVLLDDTVLEQQDVKSEETIMSQSIGRSEEVVLEELDADGDTSLDQSLDKTKEEESVQEPSPSLPVSDAVGTSQVTVSAEQAGSIGEVVPSSASDDQMVLDSSEGEKLRSSSQTEVEAAKSTTQTVIESPEELSTAVATRRSVKMKESQSAELPVIEALRRPSSRKSTSPYKAQALQKAPKSDIKTPTLKSVPIKQEKPEAIRKTGPTPGSVKKSNGRKTVQLSKRNERPMGKEKTDSSHLADKVVEVRGNRKRKCEEPVIKILLSDQNSSNDEQRPSDASSNQPDDQSHGEPEDGSTAEAADLTDDNEEDMNDDSDPHGYKDATFYLLPHGSNRGMPLLIDSFGYSYTTKLKTQYGNMWRCSVRSKAITCSARVSDYPGRFKFGKHAHNHPPKAGVTMCPLVSPLKSKDTSEDATPDLLGGVRVDSDSDLERLSARLMDLGKRMEPKGLHFRLDETMVPFRFIQKVVDTEKTRHIILATDAQLVALAAARTWYVDMTIRVIRSPFVAILGIQTYFKTALGLAYKPLLYCIMSSTKKKDYKKVFQSIMSLLPEKTGCLRIVAPFERPLWHALWKVIPQTPVYGCSYLYRKTVLEKISELGLMGMYKKRGPTCQYLQKVLALPLIPAAHIPVTFTALQGQVQSGPLRQLVAFVDLNFITDMSWPVASWCSYGKQLRSAEEAEGWYPCPQGRSNSRDPFYHLVLKLYKLSRPVTSDFVPLTQKKVCRYQEQDGQEYAPIHREWAAYSQAKCTAEELLTNCCQHYMKSNQ